MKSRLLLPALWAASQLVAHAQVGVGTTTPNASAQLDVTSTTLGFLPPRMTSAQRVGIVSPAAGLLVYQTDGIPGLYIHDGSVWSTFSGKESALTFGTGFSRDGNTITTTPASGTASGALASADWTTFNNKVSTSRSLATTAPLTGGGTLAGDLTLSLPVATTSANGYLASADWTTFNAKESVLTFSSPLSRSTNSISLPAATASANGYLASADWAHFNTAYGWGNHASAGYLTSFTETDPLFTASAAHGIVGTDITAWNAKVPATLTLSTTAPLSGGGDLSANRTLAIAQASGTADGYLSSANWSTFNGKVGGVTADSPLASSGGTTPAISITAASTGAAGSMSAADKIKLDGIATAATNYTHPTGDGNLHVIATGTSNSGKVLTAGASAGSLSWTVPASGTVASVTATSPIASSGGAAPVISLGTVPVANGGTGATSASAALTNLGAAAIASPTFTGTPAAPTAATGTNTTQLATTAFVNTAAGVHAIGDSYMGGIVFFVYDNGHHGLIAATADQSTSIKWYPGPNTGTFTNTVALALSVGSGSKNTAIIIANQGLGDGTGYAARICNEYYVTIGGVNYGDWYLPSHAELLLLYNQRSVVGGFSTGFYWSSSESALNSAYNLNFNDGVWNNFHWKGDYYYVRAIRAF